MTGEDYFFEPREYEQPHGCNETLMAENNKKFRLGHCLKRTSGEGRQILFGIEVHCETKEEI